MDFRSLVRQISRDQLRVLVIGMGISGIETARFFRRAGAEVVCVERLPQNEYSRKIGYDAEINALRDAGAKVFFDIDGEAVAPHVKDIALGMVSPGIAHESAIYAALARRGVLLATELEVGLQLYGIPVVAVTGSNGKSTTVSLLHHVLSGLGKRSVLCGNVGVPVLAGLDDRWEEARERHDVLVVEASSYQLEGCGMVRPKVGVLLNLSDNHLERHGSMERYLAAKMRLFSSQDQTDTAILNYDDRRVRSCADKLSSKVVFVGASIDSSYQHPQVRIDYRPHDGVDVLETHGVFGESGRIDLSGVHLIGRHNRYNVAAAVASLAMLGIEPSESVALARSFRPLAHRLEVVSEGPQGVVVINDSKSTTVAASLAAICSISDAYPGRRMAILMGGLVKAGSWQPLMDELKIRSQQLSPVICFGKDGRIICNHCQAAGIPCLVYPTLQSATEAALRSSRPGDVVLLSPGSASFDEFRDFEERGERFRGYVENRPL